MRARFYHKTHEKKRTIIIDKTNIVNISCKCIILFYRALYFPSLQGLPVNVIWDTAYIKFLRRLQDHELKCEESKVGPVQ